MKCFIASLVFSLHLCAQTPGITSVVPEVGEPGDLIIINGSNLGATTFVTFVYTPIPGFPSVDILQVAPQTVSQTQVTVIVPLYGSPPWPSGYLSVGFPTFNAFHFLEGYGGAITTPGTGTTQAGIGKPVISFFQSNLPVPGNPGFVLRLQNAAPGSVAAIVFGAPEPFPFLQVGDGLVVIDLTQPLFVVAPLTVDVQGNAAVILPIPGPGPLNITVVGQWALVAPSGTVFISNGMQFVL